MPKVSVILPTYNRAEFLGFAIESVLNQTFKDFEIIVSDDQSTDNTCQVVSSFNDSRISYIKNTRSKGPSGARNAAISVAVGEYIAFIDDDDEWLPDKLQGQVDILDSSQPSVCGVYSNRVLINRRTGQTVHESFGTKKLRGNLLYEFAVCNPIKTTTLVLKKSCLDEVGLFDETISYMEDRDLWIRLSFRSNFEYTPRILVRYFYHDKGQLTDNIEVQIAGKEELYARYRKIFRKNKKRWSEYVLLLGVQYCQIGRIREGRKRIVKAIKINPFKRIAYLHLFSSFFGPSIYLLFRNFYKSLNC